MSTSHFLVSLLVSCAMVEIAMATTPGKVCWEECSDGSNEVLSVSVDGCRRRRPQGGREPRFRCDGMDGPPCTMKRGDTVYLHIDFNTDEIIRNMTHDVYWVTGMGIKLPWAGMDTDVCKYLEKPCGGQKYQKSQMMIFPINVLKFYPQGVYNLKWLLSDKLPENLLQKIGCFKMTIRIV